MFNGSCDHAIRVATGRNELRINVICVSDGGKQRQILAQGAHDFIFNDMRLSNIIDRVTLLGADHAQEAETARDLFSLMRGREPQGDDWVWPVLVDQLDRMRAGTLTLMKIEPVYGATMTVLAESFRLDTIDDVSTMESR